jgi:hypothetical protein
MSDKIYNKVKWFVQIVLPAISTLYFTLGALYDLPAVEQVMGTCAALAVFLGGLIGLSTKAYNKSDEKYAGVVVVNEDADKDLYSIETFGDPEETVKNSKEVLLKVMRAENQ